VAGDERDGAKRQATTVSGAEAPMTAAKAATIARQFVKSFKHRAATQGLPALRCCAPAHRLTPASLAADILSAQRGAPERGTECVVQSEDGDLWTVDTGVSGRCW
jgi:hypothetical protein